MSAEATIASAVLMAVFIVMSAFFSSSETAFMSLQRLRVLHLANIGRPGAKEMLRRMERPEKTLATVLLGNNLVNTGAAAVGTAVAVAWLGEGLGVLVATLGVALLLLVFSEVSPKVFASRHTEWLAFRYLRPFALVEWVLFPFSVLLQWVGRTIVNLAGGRLKPASFTSQELLRSVITVGQREGAVDREEARMLHKVLSFGDRLVREVMTPRTEVIWMNEDVTLSDFLNIYDDTPLSQFPIYKENVDNIVGIVNTRDVIRAMHRGETKPDSTLLRLVRPAAFVPETKYLADLFLEMRSSGTQMVLVVDEYGGTSGLVTTQQLVEAIMGRVAGEGEEAKQSEADFTAKGSFQIEGGMSVSEANENLALNIPDGGYETVAGFVLDRLGYIPKEGESFRHGLARYTILEMKGMKVERVLVTKL